MSQADEAPRPKGKRRGPRGPAPGEAAVSFHLDGGGSVALAGELARLHVEGVHEDPMYSAEAQRQRRGMQAPR
jgi:hypothetical protein